ncbi:squalene-hopene cyclase [Xylariales sp. AK1849]|nr:squalene-hopene cyclase [Xylariales sp. AK1849]
MSLVEEVDETLRQAVGHAFSHMNDDGSWCAEVHSNTTFTAQYVFLRHQLGLPSTPEDNGLIVQWLFSQQNGDGSWGLGPGIPGDISTSVETYLALKIIGVSPSEQRMLAARECIIALGGLPATRMFTRIFLASFGLIPWNWLPTLPPELILIPSSLPVNIYNLSSWARATCIPLLLIRHYEPLYALPNGRSATNDFLDELQVKENPGVHPYAKPLWSLWRQSDYAGLLFTAADKAMSRLGQFFNSPLWNVSRKNIVKWILDHQEVSGEWAGYWPPQHNCLWALSLEGYSIDHPVMQRGLAGLHTFIRRDTQGLRAQVTVSHVWDTALMTIALNDAVPITSVSVPQATVDWIIEHEVSSHRGDWRVYNKDLPTGGWCFEEFNTLYPDVDDTAAVVIGLLKTSQDNVHLGCVRRATIWTLGMQNKDGGWGAFDWNNDKQFLNRIPFSDMDSLCDPSTPDVTSRVLESFGMMLRGHDQHAVDAALAARLRTSCQRAIRYLVRCQSPEGTWWGRWGVNYIYGTSNVLCGLARYYHAAAKLRVEVDNGLQSATRRALTWLQAKQNSDGGWGETVESYADYGLAGQGPSTATQTAWVIISLLHYLPSDDEGIRRGVGYLLRSQVKEDGREGKTWPRDMHTATGFPGHLYLTYDLYRHYFPVMALARYSRGVKQQD